MGIARAFSGAVGTTAARARPRGRPRRSVAVAALFALVALNVAVFLLPIDYRAFGAWTYPGVFIVTFIANAAIALPVPYLPIIGQVARTAELVPLVVVTAALASVLGESVAYAIGRAEKDIFADHPVYLRLQRLVGRPWRAGVALFLFAAPPNPLFDIGGIAAGALGIPFKVFFLSVLAARLVRFTILVAGVVALLQ